MGHAASIIRASMPHYRVRPAFPRFGSTRRATDARRPCESIGSFHAPGRMTCKK
jgi:hypothetical protein